MHAAWDDGQDRRRRGSVHLPHVGAGRRVGACGRRDGRRRAADAPPARRADGDDEGAARRTAVRAATRSRTCGRPRRRSTAAFGYGLASRIGESTLARERTRFAQPFEPRGTVRLVDLDEAAKAFPPLYEQVLEQRPGMFTRDKAWWETRRLHDDPGAAPRRPAEPCAARARRQAGRLRALPGRSRTGRPALERRGDDQRGGRADAGGDARALAVAARLRLDVEVRRRPAAARPRAVPAARRAAANGFQVNDGVWVRHPRRRRRRCSARTYTGDGEVVLDVTDALMPGERRPLARRARRRRAHRRGSRLACSTSPVSARCTSAASRSHELVRAFRAEELKPGAVERARRALRDRPRAVVPGDLLGG